MRHAIVIVLTLCLGTRSARADDWYGEQTLAADALAYTAVVVGVSKESDVLALGGTAAFFFATPAIHLAHGERGRAGWSLGGRIVFPLAGAAIVGNLLKDEGDDRCDDFGCGLGVTLGVVGGMLAATVVDGVRSRTTDEDAEPVMFTIGGGF
jgi:hypothetical protein